jgi:hypothetical protein
MSGADLFESGEVLAPFGPRLYRGRLSRGLVEDFNREIDEISADPQRVRELDYSDSLVGEVQQETSLPKEVFDRHAHELAQHVSRYLQELNRQGTFRSQAAGEGIEIRWNSFWVVRSFAGDYNPVHLHTRCDLACVGYLAVPDWDDELGGLEAPVNSCGQIEWIGSPVQDFVSSTYRAVPKVGDIYVFPSWMQHTVYPFLASTGERRSWSANISVKGLSPRSGELT